MKWQGCHSAAYLHPLNRVWGRIGLVDEVCVLHVLCQTLQEAERLVENHWHSNFGELLKETQGGKKWGMIFHYKEESRILSHSNPLKVKYQCCVMKALRAFSVEYASICMLLCTKALFTLSTSGTTRKASKSIIFKTRLPRIIAFLLFQAKIVVH